MRKILRSCIVVGIARFAHAHNLGARKWQSETSFNAAFEIIGTAEMASGKFLTVLLVCCALEVRARLIEQVAVGTDSFTVLEASAKEAIPFEVIESKDSYEIREYEEGGVLVAVHCHCSLAPERECPRLGPALREALLHAGDFATTEAFQSPFTISYTKACTEYLVAYQHNVTI